MDIKRTSTVAASLADADRDDWDFEILQAMVATSSPEDAALACAASWLNFVHAQNVAVVIFTGPETCVVAHGERDGSQLTINVGTDCTAVARLLKPETLAGPDGPCALDKPSRIFCWPECLSAVFMNLDESVASAERLDTVADISRRLLSRWTSPATSFADPSHMEAMAEFSAGAGHEINNPLASIVGQAQQLLKDETRLDYRQALETIGAQAWRIRDMIGDAMLFARPPQPEFTACELCQSVRDTVDRSNGESGRGLPHVTVTGCDDDVTVTADQSQLAILWNQLIRNALDAVRDQPEGVVAVEVVRNSSFAVTVMVTDNGPAIPELVRRHLFDPFYSGRQAGRGLGFGLCHCWQIVRMHNGILTHESRDNGNRFVVVLPADAAV